MKKMQGFTLIELMIVVAIIAILAAIALPAYQDYIIRSQITATLADIRGYVTAAEEIHFRSGACPAGNEDVGAPGEVTHAGNGMTLVAVGEDYLGRCVIAGTRVGGNPRADGTTVSLTRQESGEWRCTVDNDLQPKYLPTGCEPE